MVYQKKELWLCNKAFFDCETGGLDPESCEMLEAAWIITDPTGQKILAQKTCKVKPQYPERISQEAAKINGYNAADWVKAWNLTTTMTTLCSDARDAILVAHNVAFDDAFIQAALKKCNLKWAGRFQKVDTLALAWPLLQSGRIINAKLSTLTKYFNIDTGIAHRAMSDVESCRQVYLALMKPWMRLLDELEFGVPVT